MNLLGNPKGYALLLAIGPLCCAAANAAERGAESRTFLMDELDEFSDLRKLGVAVVAGPDAGGGQLVFGCQASGRVWMMVTPPDRYRPSEDEVQVYWRFDEDSMESAPSYYIAGLRQALLEGDRSRELLDAAIEADDLILKVAASETIRLSLAGDVRANLAEFRRRCADWDAVPPAKDPRPKGDA